MPTGEDLAAASRHIEKYPSPLAACAALMQQIREMNDREPYPECDRDAKDLEREEWTYDPSEQDDIIEEFVKMLRSVTADGGRKRAAGLKPSWKVDGSHREAMYRHLYAWKWERVKVDPDSGAHPLVHAAWRALAVAYRETHE